MKERNERLSDETMTKTEVLKDFSSRLYILQYSTIDYISTSVFKL